MLDPATARLCVWRLPLEAAFRLFSKLGSLGGSIRERFSRTGRTRPALARPAFSRWLLENDRLRERWPCQWLNVLYFPFSETSPARAVGRKTSLGTGPACRLSGCGAACAACRSHQNFQRSLSIQWNEFPFERRRCRATAAASWQLLPLLGNARRVEVRGRTDGQHPHAGDEKIALNRALAAQRFLIGQGVSPAIISVNYVSAGDYVADNFSAVGRSQNRRVDIVVFNK